MNTTANKALDYLVANGALENIAKDLKLNKIPTIQYENVDESYVMAAGGTVWCQGNLFHETVTKTESDYIIRVNLHALQQTQRQYFLLCLNPRIMYDVTLVLLKHECRHIWQYQEQFTVGDVREKFKLNLEAHGASKIEQDANQYAVDTSKGRRWHLAMHCKMLQEKGPFSFSISKEERQINRNVIRKYNPVLFFLCKYLL